MTHVITGACCADSSCVTVCPVDCIHPTPSDPDFFSSSILYIDPDSCIDCGACVDACPIDAIAPDFELSAGDGPFLEAAADYFRSLTDAPPSAEGTNSSEAAGGGSASSSYLARPRSGLRVAIIGSGAAGGYVASELLTRGAEVVDVYERRLAPYGLVRYGIAPDHADTKAVGSVFPFGVGPSNCRLILGAEVGADFSLQDLTSRYHAVVVATGSSGESRPDLPGAPAERYRSAREFVSWYNGDLDLNTDFDLTHERVLVVGNGNVALDVARVLTGSLDILRATDISDAALAALAHRKIRQVVVAGRRGVHEAAFSLSELLRLTRREDISLSVNADDLDADRRAREALGLEAPGWESRRKARLLESLGRRADRPEVALRFLLSPHEAASTESGVRVGFVRNTLRLDGDGSVVAQRIGDQEWEEFGLILYSAGYRAQPIAGLPFDSVPGVVPNLSGRVVSLPEQQSVVGGLYVAGWIKRGARGGVGTNRACAVETVGSLLEDFDTGALTDPLEDRTSVDAWIKRAFPAALDNSAWSRVDQVERELGAALNRPRIKLTQSSAVLAAAHGNYAS